MDITSFMTVKRGLWVMNPKSYWSRGGSFFCMPTNRNLQGKFSHFFSSGCSERLKIFPSGSLNHATFAPVGEAQMPSSS